MERKRRKKESEKLRGVGMLLTPPRWISLQSGGLPRICMVSDIARGRGEEPLVSISPVLP